MADLADSLQHLFEGPAGIEVMGDRDPQRDFGGIAELLPELDLAGVRVPVADGGEAHRVVVPQEGE